MKTKKLLPTFLMLLSLSAVAAIAFASPNAEARRDDVVYTSASQAQAALDDLFLHLKQTEFANCSLVSDAVGKGVTLIDQNGTSVRMTSDVELQGQTLNLRLSDSQPALSFAIEGKIRGFRTPKADDPASKLLVFVETTKDGRAIKSVRTRLESKYLVDIGTIARPEKEARASVDYDGTCVAKR